VLQVVLSIQYFPPEPLAPLYDKRETLRRPHVRLLTIQNLRGSNSPEPVWFPRDMKEGRICSRSLMFSDGEFLGTWDSAQFKVAVERTY